MLRHLVISESFEGSLEAQQMLTALLQLVDICPQDAVDVSSSTRLELDAVGVELDGHGVGSSHHNLLDEGLDPEVEVAGGLDHVLPDHLM